MVTEIKLERTDKIVVVVGLAGAGKTTVTEQLHKRYPEYKLFNTDNYMEHGFNDALNVIMNDVVYFDTAPYKLVEGVQCFRMLRTGVEANCFYPQVVINVLATEQVRYGRRPGKNYRQMDATLRMIWMSYNRMMNPRPPRLIEIVND